MPKIVQYQVPKQLKQELLFQQDRAPLFPNYHRHPEIQITWFHRPVNYIIADKIGRIEKDEVWVLGSNTSHVFQNPDQELDGELMMSSIFLPDPDQGSPLYEVKELAFLKGLLRDSLRVYHLRVSKRFKQRFKALFELPNPKAFIKALQILDYLNRKESKRFLEAIHIDPMNNEKEEKRLHRVMQFMIDHVNRQIEIDEIASIAHLSPTSFCRFFKDQTGRSFADFFRAIRMQKAGEMLMMSSDRSIGDIASELGFENQSTFNRNFKKVFGMTPRNFKQLKA